MVAMTRQQIADPETVNKMREGRLDEIRRCIGCNQGCIDRLFAVTHSSCVHNPAAGYELELGIGTLQRAATPSASSSSEPARPGMKAAETAARIGHEVDPDRAPPPHRRPAAARRVESTAASEIGGVVTTSSVRSTSTASTCGSVGRRRPPRCTALDPTTSSSPRARRRAATSSATSPTASRTRRASITTTCSPSGTSSRTARTVGAHVLVVDDGEGGWKAIGLALQLADHGHEVHLELAVAVRGGEDRPVQPATD